jgi:trehalose-6-phosphate synthase
LSDTTDHAVSHQALKKDEFYALLSVADLAVITPLRDGMNTTSMEFVIAQKATNKSPSVLSEFMGISKNMEDALLVNPWNLGVSVAHLFDSYYRAIMSSRTWLLLLTRV